MNDYASEGGHWYTSDGVPAYTQEIASGKNKGKERPTTIRDARKLGLVPSVTTITGILDKPALTAWKCRQAVEKVTNPDYKPDTSAEKGSKIHGAIEHWLETGKVRRGYRGYINVVERVLGELGIEHPISERSFATTEFGGAVDLHDKEANIILDFKTKKEVETGKDYHYDEHAMQLAAYREGLGMKGAKCYNLFLSRTTPDNYSLHEWEEEDVQRGWAIFYHLKEVWMLTRRFGKYAA